MWSRCEQYNGLADGIPDSLSGGPDRFGRGGGQVLEHRPGCRGQGGQRRRRDPGPQRGRGLPGHPVQSADGEPGGERHAHLRQVSGVDSGRLERDESAHSAGGQPRQDPGRGNRAVAGHGRPDQVPHGL